MMFRPNLLSGWLWRPGSSFGPLVFGQRLPSHIDGVVIVPVRNIDNSTELMFRLEDEHGGRLGAYVYVDDGVVFEVEVSQCILFAGINLIGLTLHGLSSLLRPGGAVPQIEFGLEGQYSFPSLGLTAFAVEGEVESIQVSSPDRY